MSAIGGIINFDGVPVDADLLTQLSTNLEAHGPDGGGEICQNSVGVVCRSFHTNVESRGERQPLVSNSGCILAWDGRLDNREELMAPLQDQVASNSSDNAIVSAAYEKSTSFPERLIGDFAFSLWDPGSRTLLLARDHVGTRPLFYYLDHNRLIWSTRLESLLDLPEIKLEVN